MRAYCFGVGLLLVSGLAAADAASPRSVTDYYELLAQKKEVEAVMAKQGGQWRYVAKLDDEAVGAQGAPLIDVKNGYIALSYGYGACDSNDVELALFNGQGGKRYIGVGYKRECSESNGSGVHFYEFTGASYRDITKQSGALGQLKTEDFLDEKYVASPQARADRLVDLSSLGFILYKIPRQGTTVVVRLEPPAAEITGVDVNDIKKATQLIKAHRKYRAIELAWSPAEGRFTVARKVQ